MKLLLARCGIFGIQSMIGLILIILLAGCSEPSIELTPEDIAQNNRGVALMGQYENEQARAIFAELAQAHPDWLDVRVNEAIATLNRQREGDEQLALAMVQALLLEQPDHVRARYVAALMEFYLGNSEAALPNFLQVAEAAPGDAHVAYFTAQVLSQLERIDEALAYYKTSMELDPYLRSAYYGAALALRKLGDADQARAMLVEYQRFENNPRAHLAEFRYTRKGPLAEALAVDADRPAQQLERPQGHVFEAPVEKLVIPTSTGSGRISLSTADINEDGAQDIFLADPQGLSRVLIQSDDGFIVDQQHPLANIANVQAAAWGAPDITDRLGVYLCRDGHNELLIHDAENWLTSAARDDVADPGQCADAAWLDADHDGDLDLYVVNRVGANELFSNNYDDSFRRLSKGYEPRLAGLGSGRQLLAVDLDGDRDVDHLVVNQQPPHQVLINDRLWQYQPGDGFDELIQTDLQAVTAGDLNADGQLELISIGSGGQLLHWQKDPALDWQATELIELLSLERPELALHDFDGDGSLDLLLSHARGFSVFALDGLSVNLMYEDSAALRGLLPILLNPAEGLALVGVVDGSEGNQLRIWSPGSGRSSFVAIQPSGRSDQAEGIRSNSSGIGTGLVVRTGQQWAVTDTYDRNSSPGQSLQPIVLGLGNQHRADFIQLFWTDGVFQTEMDLAAGQIHKIAENQRQLASCPVLFAFNGQAFEFVSDVLGVGGIGFLVEPGRYAEPRPWEYFMFPDATMQPRNGRYALKIGEPMQEIAYIDHARLHLHDLPPGWSMTLDERMFTGGGEEPTGRAIYYREQSIRQPNRALNDRSEDVTASLLQVDQQAAPVGELDKRFLGLLQHDHVLTLEFAEVINPAGSRPVLVANGWVEYPYSQTVFAAWQANRGYHAPSLEAYADGQWQMVYEHFGYPAGMPREMSLSLAGLPPNTTQLRIRSNLQIYWDRLMVVEAARPESLAIVQHSLTPALARLAKTGFARRDTLDQRRPFYEYQDRTPFWDTEYQTGFYTAYGPVEPLVAEMNNAFALVGPGEELHLEYIAPEPPTEGYRRVVVLEVRGYAKDKDLYTESGRTVGPMPFTEGVGDRAARDRLHDQYHTRFQGGH
ncbi:MAG: FG-GAP-like repeat-containing protein [Pseudomonadota bacterium]